ncbi:hypothetical protein DPMN_053248 [Dreissena polymorpha]|uniref:Uncharacterized protein n=1 Tax=Dreissena polymorpha TaxID=45954 RepID=A0A9D4HNN5_DREPO|nr:hypothetical protein DPMN_053248 [Dreissena polymorpha]
MSERKDHVMRPFWLTLTLICILLYTRILTSSTVSSALCILYAPLCLRQHKTDVLQQTPKIKVLKARPFTESFNRAQRCVQNGCERYGDPKQENRCLQHYLEAKARYSPDFTQEKLKDLHKIQEASGAAQLALSVHAGYQATMPHLHAQTTVGYPDEFLSALAMVENSRKIIPALEGYCYYCA